MCGGDFLSKNPEEAMDFLSYVAETSKAWNEPNPREVERMRSASSSRGDMYSLPEDMELKAKLSTLARRVEELERKRLHEVQAVTEVPLQANLCFICQSTEHVGEQCPTIPVVKEMFSDQENFVGQSKPPPNAPYNNTCGPNWINHPNLSWKLDPPAHVPLGARQQSGSSSQPQPPPTSSPVEQAIVNLSKVVGEFVEEKKGINVQLAQGIDTVESTLKKK